MNLKMMKIIKITAIIFVLICLYKIYLYFGALSYQSKLNFGYSVKGPVSLLILFQIIVYSCGIVVAIAMYFRKSWSHRPALAINYYLLVTSSISLLLFLPNFRIDLLSREAGYLISIILPLTSSLWCVYYLRRSEVRANFNKESITATLESKITSYKPKFKFGIILPLLILIIIIFLFKTFSTLEKSTAHFAKSSLSPTNDRSKVLYKPGCSRAVGEIFFSQDGQYIYAFDEEGSQIIWNVADGREIREIKSPLGRPGAALFSPNGKFIASKSNGNLVIWDLQSAKEISRINVGEPRIMREATFSHDGKYIISSLDNHIICAWNVFTGQVIHKFEGAKGWVESISFSPNGKYLVATRKWRSDSDITKGIPHEKSIVLWDYETGEKLWERDSQGKSTFVNFSPNGKFIAVGSYANDDAILLLDVVNGNQLKSFSGYSGAVYFINFSPDGKYLLSGGKDSIIRLWDIASGKEIKQLVGHSSDVITALFSPDGKNIISSGKDETIRLWSTASGKEIRKFERNCRAFYSVAFAPSGYHILSVSSDNSLRLWDVQSGQEIKSFNSSDKVFTATFSPDGKYVVSSASNNMLIIFDALSGKKIKTFSGHTDFISSAVFTPDGKNIVSGSNDKTIRIWDVSLGKELQKFTVQNTGVKNVSVSPDGQYIVSCGFDNGERRTNMKLWSISTGKEILEYMGYSAESSASFSPDSKFVLSCGGRAAAAWLINKEIYDRNFVHTDTINSVRFSPDGKKIVTGSSDRTIRLWDFASQKELSVFRGHTAAVTSVAFSPDGRQIISGSMDNTIRLWDVASGKELRQFEIK